MRQDRRIVETLTDSLWGEGAPQVHDSMREESFLVRRLNQAGMRRSHLVRDVSVICLLMTGAYSVSRSAAVCVGAGAIGAVLMVLRISRRIRARRLQVERDLPALLTTMASSVRAGIDPITALMHAQRFFDPTSILAESISQFKRDFTAGEDEERLLRTFLKDLSNSDVELFKRCILLSRRHGASLAEPLHRVVRVVRQRQSFRRKTRAALAMHRMSAIGIGFCAIFIAGIQGVMNYSGVALAWHHPVGGTFLSVGMGLLAVGIVWMLSMGREEAL